jgi:hypothetical protein
VLDHIHYAIFQDAAWSAAVAAWLILLVTTLAAGFGVPAAIAAAKTFQLESDPIILIREKDPVEQVTLPYDAPIFVVSGKPLIADGIELRERRPSDDFDPNAGLAWVTRVGIVLHNAGRSPAIAIKIPVTVTTQIYSDWRAGDGDPGEIETLEGRGVVALNGIDANSTTYVFIENLLGNAVILTVQPTGSCVEIRGEKRRERLLGVVALQDITLPAP